MTQETLTGMRVAPSAVTVTAQYHWRTGWSVRLSWRSAGPQGFQHRDYEGLTTPELVDVVGAELEQIVAGSPTSG